MHDSDYLNWRRFPMVNNDVGVEVPEAIAGVEKFLVLVTDARGLAQTIEPRMELRTQTLCG